MTSGSVNELPNSWRQDSPGKEAAKAFAFILTMGAAGLLLVAGHPRSKWYFSFFLALAAIAAMRAYRTIERPQPDQPRIIETGPARLRRAAFVVVAVTGFGTLYNTLLLSDLAHSWVPALGGGLALAILWYRTPRGRPNSNSTRELVEVALLLLLASLLFLILFGPMT